MKLLTLTRTKKILFSTASAIAALVTITATSLSVKADTASDTNRLLDWAEITYPSLFPSHKNTQIAGPWIYRYYSEAGVYAGVNTSDGMVYVLGGTWGKDPKKLGTLPALLSLIGGSNTGGWSSPTSLSGSGAGAPVVAIDNAGNAMALWTQINTPLSLNDLWSSRYSPGTGWSTPSLLETDNVANVKTSEFHINIEPVSGKAIATWQQFTSAGKFDLWARIYVPATGWGAAVRIEDSTDTIGISRAGIDANGNVIVVWSQIPTNGRTNIYANRYSVALGWGTSELLETNNNVGGGDGDPRIAVTPAGNAFVVWLSNPGISGSGTDIWQNRYSLGSGWGTASELVSDNSTNLQLGNGNGGLELVNLANGEVMLAWAQLDFKNAAYQYSIQTKRNTNGNWQSGSTPVAPLVATKNGLSSNFAIAANQVGAVAVSWALDDYSVQASIATVNGTFTAPVAVKAPGPLEVLSVPDIGIDSSGNAFAVWQQKGAAGVINIWAAQYKEASGWNSSELVSEIMSSLPTLAVAGNGNAVLTWHNFPTTQNGTFAYGKYYTVKP